MNTFLKSVRLGTNKKDDLIKQSITTQLSDSVKEIQYACVEEIKTNKTVNIFEAANALCTAIEAMLLHGLKDSLTHRFKRAIADVEERPEPSFWSPLLVISHRQIVEQITNLSQITTEVGQCRAWIRLALNDCLLSSYLMTMRQVSSTLKSFYRIDAYVRDTELLEVAQRLIEGVESFKTFTLPCNSSLLNVWPLPSLFLAGIWAPTLKTCPVAPCDDVAQSIDGSSIPPSIPESSETASLSSVVSYTSQGSGLRQIVALTEDEVLKIILAKDKGTLPSNNFQSLDDLKSSCSSEQEKNNELEGITNYNVGNSLNRATGWSFDENQEEASDAEEDVLNKQVEKEPTSMDTSYNALIESYNMLSVIKTPDFREVWQKYEEERQSDTSTEDKSNDEIMENKGVIPDNLILVRNECTSLAAQIGQIAREKGLDIQNYECTDCKQHLGVVHKPNLCGFTGDYFCDSCISTELVSIPARIIYNWDFKVYPISHKGLIYLNEIKHHPTIDFKVLNPYIYTVIEEMAQLQILRNQLNFLRAYLYTCREPIIEQLQKKMWPREYMYEHIHQYSILDLSEIMNGALAKQLQEVVQFGKDHVSSCWLCSQKGFVCEICNKPKALFPFDVDNVYRCDICNAVYHKNCLNSSIPCPKCERRRKREELPLLRAISIE